MYETKFMRRALELSHKGMKSGHGGPFGCVIVKEGIVVGEAHNEVLSSNDPTAHAELLAVRRASAELKTFNLTGCEAYTNGAPCCMCMSSMLWARVSCAAATSCRWMTPARSASVTNLFTQNCPDRSKRARLFR